MIKMTFDEFVLSLRADEMSLRNMEAPTPQTLDELSMIISALRGLEHDYGSSAAATALATAATFNFMAHHFGLTGFQAGCADLDVLQRTRRIKGPFMIVQLQDELYPQYDIVKKVAEFREKNKDWLAVEASKMLAERDENIQNGEPDFTAPRVVEHWRNLVEACPMDTIDVPQNPSETKQGP